MLGTLQRRIAYYKKLQQLTEKQQKKMDSYIEQLKQLKPNSKTINEKVLDECHKMRYEIGNLKFHTQEEANEYFQNFLKDHETEDIDDDCVALVQRHPAYNDGDKIEIRPNETFPQWKNFVIVKPTGETKHLSIKTCLRGRRTASDIKQIFRWIIKPQINEFREASAANQPDTCPSCQKFVESFEVDHIKPFKLILNEFLDLNHVNINEVKTKQQKGMADLADEELKNKWIQFHRENAHYQLICPKCNNVKRDKF